MTLAYDDANSKLIDVVTVAYVDDEPVEDNLVKLSKVKFLVKILRMRFGQATFLYRL